MKILRVINSLEFGGAERSIATNVPIHLRNGFDMEVLLLSSQSTFFENELIKAGVKVHFLGKKITIYNPILIFKLFAYLKKYDIVHAHLFPTFYWVAIAKMLSFSDTVLVFTEHSTNNRRRNNKLFKFIDQLIYSQYKTIITISEASKKSLVNQINSSEKITVVENGIDIQRLMQLPRDLSPELTGLLANKCVIVQVAGFRKSKDQDTVIKALANLNDHFCLVLVGDGERKSTCYDLAKSLNVLHKVHFVGLQENIAPFLQNSHIVVMSSHWEGFGRAAVEGMAFAKPVIATNVSGLADVVKDAGLLFETGAVDELTKLILKLADDKSFYDEIANKCAVRAQQYDIVHMIKKYENIYLNISNHQK